MLFVEGSESAAERFVDLVCAHSRIKWQIHRVVDAYDAIDYLSGFGQSANRARFPLPHVVLLDVNSGTTDGLDMLAWIRGDGRFRGLPVVVTSTAATCLEAPSARELGLRAWFAQADDYPEVIALCEALGLSALTEMANDFQKHWGSARRVSPAASERRFFESGLRGGTGAFRRWAI
jgi:CheY-like chemotaxis protein